MTLTYRSVLQRSVSGVDLVADGLHCGYDKGRDGACSGLAVCRAAGVNAPLKLILLSAGLEERKSDTHLR